MRMRKPHRRPRDYFSKSVRRSSVCVCKAERKIFLSGAKCFLEPKYIFYNSCSLFLCDNDICGTLNAILIEDDRNFRATSNIFYSLSTTGTVILCILH